MTYPIEIMQAADAAIHAEFNVAMQKFPAWDYISLPRMARILSEECGEAVQAINDYLETLDMQAPGCDIKPLLECDLKHFLKEIAQVGGVARRILCEMELRKQKEETYE